MFKNVLLGMAAVAIACALAGAGHSPGRHLAEAERAGSSSIAPT
jgi:hypothetical protein